MGDQEYPNPIYNIFTFITMAHNISKIYLTQSINQIEENYDNKDREIQFIYIIVYICIYILFKSKSPLYFLCYIYLSYIKLYTIQLYSLFKFTFSF